MRPEFPPHLPTMKKDKPTKNGAMFVPNVLLCLIISAIIITGGEGTGDELWNDLSSVEVFSPSGVSLPCTVPPLPISRWDHTQDGEVACGGGRSEDTTTQTTCVTLTASGWATSHKVQETSASHLCPGNISTSM